MARTISDWELLILFLISVPVLFFDAWMPVWAIVIALSAIPILWLIRWLGYGSPTRPTPLDVPILILLLMVPVGVWAAAVKPLALPQIYRIVLGIALFYAVVNTLNSGRRLWTLTSLLLAAVLVLSLIAVLGIQRPGSKVPMASALYSFVPAFFRPFWRPEGLGSNSIAGGLVMLLPLSVAFGLGGRRWLLKVACILISLLGGFALIFAQSRGAIIGLALAALVMGTAWKRRVLLVVPTALLAGLVALGVLGWSRISEFMFPSIATSAGISLELRLELWMRALYMIRDFPLTGVGLGMFDQVIDLFYPLFLTSLDVDMFHAHNIFLSQAVDTGLLGLVAYLAMILVLLVMAWQSSTMSRQKEWWPLAMGLLGAIVAYVGHGIFDSPTAFIRTNTILWLVFGLQAALWLHLQRHGQVQGSLQA